MNFLTTCYVYPLVEKICISKSLNAYLDNPRTEEEVSAVKEYIEKAYSIDTAFRFPPYSDEDILTLESFILDFRQFYSDRDPYVSKFCASYMRETLFDFLARMWIVARFDDKGQIDFLKKEGRKLAQEGKQGFFMLEEESPIIVGARQLADYSYLLSLLIHTQEGEYNGTSFIIDLDPHQYQQYVEPNRHLPLHLLYFGFGCKDNGERIDNLRWYFLPHIRNNLERAVQNLNSAFTGGYHDKLMYVGSLLKVVGHDVKDEKIKLVVLVSIIELLLTHSPDFNRFNVEDSIGKQFRLKASLLIYLNDKSQDLNAIKKRLKTIYNLRSSVAHGNFKSVQKYLQGLSKKEGEEEYCEDLISDLYQYIRAILLQYLADPQLVEFLKDN